MIALDRVLANVDKSQIIPKNVEGVKADPPAIFYSTTPAILVNIDGDPIWSPIKDNDLKFAVNTNWDLFQHEPTKTFYLRNEQTLAQGDRRQRALDAGRQAARRASRSCRADDNWKDVKAALPGKQLSDARAEGVREHDAGRDDPAARRAELPAGRRARPICSGCSNTESDVFRLGKTGPVYYLVAGRWFSAPDFTGPWTFATPTLPAGLQEDSARASALARARVGAGHRRRPPRRCCSRRFRRPRA